MESFQLIFEILVIVVVVSLQLRFFSLTRSRIKNHSNFFPPLADTDTYSFSSDYSQNTFKQISILPEYSVELQNVISSINSYLKKNSGTADFSIIKSIVERSIDSKENHVSVNISLPLYIGLMGTFSGVIIGLLQIAFGGGVTEQNINSFIGGVVIAMIASFFGLLLTVLNNSKNFKESKAICDERKNYFYDFLQVELLPHIGNSLFDALDRLKSNINDFNSKFEKSINLFDSKFSENISSLGVSVKSLSENINLVVDNTNTQKEFLLELRRIGYNRMAEANIKVFQLLKDTGPTFIKFIESQKELSQSVENANQFVGVIESILNRIQTFEESINNLGEHINASKFLGNDVLNRIDINLRYLDQQCDLLKQHEHKSSDSIKDYFEKQYSEIQKLTDSIKKEIQEAMNFKIDQNPLQKLLVLDTIDYSLSELNKKVNFNGEFKLLSENFNKTALEIKEIKQQISIAIDETRKNKKSNSKPKPNPNPKSEVVPTIEQENKKGFWRRLIRR